MYWASDLAVSWEIDRVFPYNWIPGITMAPRLPFPSLGGRFILLDSGRIMCDQDIRQLFSLTEFNRYPSKTWTTQNLSGALAQLFPSFYRGIRSCSNLVS